MNYDKDGESWTKSSPFWIIFQDKNPKKGGCMSSLNQKIETPNPYAREDCPSLSRFSFGDE